MLPACRVCHTSTLADTCSHNYAVCMRNEACQQPFSVGFEGALKGKYDDPCQQPFNIGFEGALKGHYSAFALQHFMRKWMGRICITWGVHGAATPSGHHYWACCPEYHSAAHSKHMALLFRGLTQCCLHKVDQLFAHTKHTSCAVQRNHTALPDLRTPALLFREPTQHCPRKNDCILALDVLPSHVLQLLHDAGWLPVNGHLGQTCIPFTFIAVTLKYTIEPCPPAPARCWLTACQWAPGQTCIPFTVMAVILKYTVEPCPASARCWSTACQWAAW
eukprot:1160219-Pelagomonas_calceolata.AAC.1